MLGNITRKLRIFGYDTEFFLDIDDSYFIDNLLRDGRIVLTRDKQLYFKLTKQNSPTILLSSYCELDNLVLILKKCGIDKIEMVPNRFTRCTKCNGELFTQDKSLEFAIIPQKVFDTIALISKCNSCSKIYWNGTHMMKINLLVDNINNTLIST
jgi:uncharacterized protein with PIN domain